MTDIRFSFEHSFIAIDHVRNLFRDLSPEIIRIKHALIDEYSSIYGSIFCPFDKDHLYLVQSLVDRYKQVDIAAVVVIGIDGSIMGTRAIASMLNKKLIFLETVDSDVCAEVLEQIETVLKADQKVVVSVVTKSGTTTETIVNFQLVLNVLQKYLPDTYQQYVVVTTDSGSPFEAVAQSKQFQILSIPPLVGGRYSVFSAVGLFPLALVGCDIVQLLAGARDGFHVATQEDFSENSAAYSACVKLLQYRSGITLFDMFIFSLGCADSGLWYRQLFAESLGKKYDIYGSLVEVGMTPLVSIGSTDLHSIGQRYLGGSRALFTTFLHVEKNNTELYTPEYSEFNACVAHIQDRPVADVMQAILSGTKQAYVDDYRPFMSVTLPEKNAYFCGKLLQLYMLEVMYMGYLLKVNPFDQPDVERYKVVTRKLLQS